jgi:hypothetical protein
MTATKDEIVFAIRKARQLVAMLQGTMGLEGQGLDRKTLRELRRDAILEWLGRSN